MGLKEYIKRGIKYIISGVPEKTIYANISYLEPNNRLNGKKIIVTGGGRGLGFAMAKKFVSEGAEVLIIGRNEDVLRASAKEINCKYLSFDVTDIDKYQDLFVIAEELLGGIDSLVNNAGISLHEGDFKNVTCEQFDKQFDTNLKSGYFLSQKFVQFLINRKVKNGNILFISSERGFYVDDLPYGLTKVALNSFVQGLAYKLIKNEIRVNAIAPGVTASDMTGFSADGNLYAPFNITDRIYLPEEVAEVASFLLSGASACLNGQILICNQGKSINPHWK